MNANGVEQYLVLAGALFSVGLVGLLVRRTIVFTLMSIELMFNGAGLTFIIGGMRHGAPDGQIMFLFILAIAAAEVAVGLTLVFLQDRRFKDLDTDKLSTLRG